jgi:hypothetical protein
MTPLTVPIILAKKPHLAMTTIMVIETPIFIPREILWSCP